jgi:putative membrane protein
VNPHSAPDAPVLRRFGVTPADLLGRGGESDVYALDAERVLRVYGGDDLGYLTKRQAFYAWLRSQGLPFDTPELWEVGREGEHLYALERRMRGRDFALVLPTLHGADRTRALSSYLMVAGQIGQVALPEQPFGELVTPDTPLQAATWDDYLAKRMDHILAESYTDLAEDVPDFAGVLAEIERRLAQVAHWPEKRLVHGDYFPGNVFIDDGLMVCGVGDFGYSTLAGDPRLDLAGALAFVEVVNGYRPEDSAWLRRELAAHWGVEMLAVAEGYRLYYAIYFSRCKADDPRTYWWCVGALRALRAGGAAAS